MSLTLTLSRHRERELGVQTGKIGNRIDRQHG
jgi:hypothetical protein